MVSIENTLVSDEIFEEYFCCDIAKCKGCCCIEGDAGAPLDEDELPILEKYFPVFKQFMQKEGLEEIERIGRLYDVLDFDKSYVTPIINKKECVYLVYDEAGFAWCAIEKAHMAGLIPFKKPISCHLFPIRISKYPHYEAVNYFRWDICKHAFRLGKKKNITVLEFLKEALIRKYGESWYDMAEAYYKEFYKNKV